MVHALATLAFTATAFGLATLIAAMLNDRLAAIAAALGMAVPTAYRVERRRDVRVRVPVRSSVTVQALRRVA